MSKPSEPSRIIPTSEQLRGLAHPVRTQILGLLRLDGPQTATGLAGRLGINSGATSYHLRQLARHGFIEEVAELGTERERWWRAAHRWTSVPDAAFEGAGEFLQAAVVTNVARLQASVEEFAELPAQWQRGSTHSDWVVRLTAQESFDLVEHLSDYLSQLMAERESVPAEGAEQVMVQLHVFPRPGVLPHRDDPS